MKDPEYFDSQHLAAIALNIDIESVRQAKRDGCKAFRSGRVYRKQLVDFLKTRKPDKEKTRQAYLTDIERLRAENMEIEMALKKGLLLRKEELEVVLGQFNTNTTSVLQRLPYTIASRVAGLTNVEEISAKIAEETNAALTFLQSAEYLSDRAQETLSRMIEEELSPQFKSRDAKQWLRKIILMTIPATYRQIGKRTLLNILQISGAQPGGETN